MNERIKYVYKSILAANVKIVYGGECGEEKFIILLDHSIKQESLRIPR